jgi:hypothetical protein
LIKKGFTTKRWRNVKFNNLKESYGNVAKILHSNRGLRRRSARMVELLEMQEALVGKLIKIRECRSENSPYCSSSP